MGSRSFPPVAVIADAHFHDTAADFGFAGIAVDGQQMTMRSWSDTRQSTRVFNESADALRAALDRVAARNIRHVVLLGDYTDDGQRATTETLRGLLQAHSDKHGTAFYALPGNHDIFGPKGRHHTKEFLGENGQAVEITSDPTLAGNNVVFSDDMYCEGYPSGLNPMAKFGYFRRAEYLHWETPFGTSDAVEDRVYTVVSPDGKNRYELMDASYLVEPEPGLWLVMIDANVFEPLDGSFVSGEEKAFTDSTSGGWNAMLRSKRFIIDWLVDVSQRARQQGKTLLAFSHYPALDPFDGASGAEASLFGETNVVRRTPVKAVEDALIAAGISVHFSGHLHVEGMTRREQGDRSLTNIAVPSLVAFPPAFKVVHAAGHEIAIETVEMSDLPVNARLSAGYARETDLRGEEQGPAFSAEDYGDFLRQHKRALVRHRYFVKEWPTEIVAAIGDKSVFDVIGPIFAIDDAATSRFAGLADLPMFELIADWYCLRQGASLALLHIEPEKLMLYRWLASRFGQAPGANDGSLSRFFAIFLGALGLFLDRAEGGSQNLVLPVLAVDDAVPA